MNRTSLIRIAMFLLVPVIAWLGYLLALLKMPMAILLVSGALGGMGYGWLGFQGFKGWLSTCDPELVRTWRLLFHTGTTRVSTVVVCLLLYIVFVLAYKERFPFWGNVGIFSFATLLIGLPVELLLIRDYTRSNG